MQTGNPSSYVRWFKDLRNSDVALVGGKNASLGEMYATLAPKGVRVPNGFAITAAGLPRRADRSGRLAEAARAARHARQDRRRRARARAAAAREIVYEATGAEALRRQIAAGLP